VNFQVTVLKVLVSYPGGFALLAALKRDVALLATTGRDWAERTKRLAARIPDLDIFSQRLVDRVDGGWRINDAAVSGADPIEIRPGFAALLDRIEGNGVRTVIVEDASRFARELGRKSWASWR
jgi:Resolvase, N terminal domain